MSNSKMRSVLGIFGVLVIALIAVWLLMPAFDTGPDPQAATPAASAPLGTIAAIDAEANPSAPPSLPQVVIIDGDGDVPRTKTCTMIAGWAQRRVPHYTILDNIRDQSMRFTKDDLTCLTAARDVPPIVLDFAEMYQLRDQE